MEHEEPECQDENNYMSNILDNQNFEDENYDNKRHNL